MITAMKPSANTIVSGGVGTTVAIILPWFLKEFMGREVPYEVAVALGSLIATGAGYLVDVVQSLLSRGAPPNAP